MNLRLCLMRHAQTEKSHPQGDLMRNLTEEGVNEAKEATNFIKDYQIDKVVVSYAKRTMQTLKYLREAFGDIETEIVEELYNLNEEAAINLIECQGDQFKHILVIGHNPVIYNTALQRSNENDKKHEYLVKTGMPPARIVILDFKQIVNWAQIAEEKADIYKIFTPAHAL